MSPSSCSSLHFETSFSENEEDYVLYQRLDGNGCPVINDIIRIPCSQVSSFRSIKNPSGQPCRSSISRVPVAICFPHSSKDAIEYQHRNFTFFTKLHRMMMDELLHQKEYIEKLEAQVLRLSTRLDQQQLENEKLMSQRLTNENIKADEVAEILKESAGSDDDDGYLENIEVSTCSENPSIDIIEAIGSDFGHLFERNESQGSSKSDSASYGQETFKSELTVDEAIHHSLNLDFEENENVCIEILPMSNNYSERGYVSSDGQASVNQVIHNHFNINVTIPSININCISRSKVSGTKIAQKQRRTDKTYSYRAKPSKNASSNQVTNNSNALISLQSDDITEEEENQEANGVEDGNQSNLQENEHVIVREPSEPAERRENLAINEESQEEDVGSDASLESNDSNSGYFGSDEEVNQGANNSKSLGNQVNYISSNKRKTDSRCSNDQYQTVNPLISVRKSSMKGCRQIQKASALQQCENGCEPFDDYAVKSGRATLGNQVNHVTSGKRNAYIRRTNEQNITAKPKLEQNRHSKSQSQQIQKVSASQQCGNGCDPSDDSADKTESANLGNQVNYVKSGNQNVNPRINMSQNINAMPKPEQNRHSMSKSQQIQNCNNTATGLISNKF